MADRHLAALSSLTHGREAGGPFFDASATASPTTMLYHQQQQQQLQQQRLLYHQQQQHRYQAAYGASAAYAPQAPLHAAAGYASSWGGQETAAYRQLPMAQQQRSHAHYDGTYHGRLIGGSGSGGVGGAGGILGSRSRFSPYHHQQQQQQSLQGMFTPAGQQLIPTSVLHYPPRNDAYRTMHQQHQQQQLQHHQQQPQQSFQHLQPPQQQYSQNIYEQQPQPHRDFQQEQRQQQQLLRHHQQHRAYLHNLNGAQAGHSSGAYNPYSISQHHYQQSQLSLLATQQQQEQQHHHHQQQQQHQQHQQEPLNRCQTPGVGDINLPTHPPLASGQLQQQRLQDERGEGAAAAAMAQDVASGHFGMMAASNEDILACGREFSSNNNGSSSNGNPCDANPGLSGEEPTLAYHHRGHQQIQQTLQQHQHQQHQQQQQQQLTTSPPLMSAGGTDSGISVSSGCSTRGGGRSESTQSTPVYSGEYPPSVGSSSGLPSYHYADGKELELEGGPARAAPEEVGAEALCEVRQEPAEEAPVGAAGGDGTDGAVAADEDREERGGGRVRGSGEPSQPENQPEDTGNLVPSSEEPPPPSAPEEPLDSRHMDTNLSAASAAAPTSCRQPVSLTTPPSSTATATPTSTPAPLSLASSTISASGLPTNASPTHLERGASPFLSASAPAAAAPAPASFASHAAQPPQQPEEPASPSTTSANRPSAGPLNSSWSPFPSSPNSWSHRQSPVAQRPDAALAKAPPSPPPVPAPPHNSPVDYRPAAATSMAMAAPTSKRSRVKEAEPVPGKRAKRKPQDREEPRDAAEERRDVTPLPGFQQAFGSTEIGRFSETFLLTPAHSADLYPSPAYEEASPTADYFDAPLPGDPVDQYRGPTTAMAHAWAPYEPYLDYASRATAQFHMRHQGGHHRSHHTMGGHGAAAGRHAVMSERFGPSRASVGYGEIRCNGY